MVYLMLADGFEEIEALTPLDILRRAEIEVQTVGVTGQTVTGAHSIPVKADITIKEINLQEITAIILPGGMPGTLNLKADKTVEKAIITAFENGKLIAAICAAPSILGSLGLLKNKTATCFPGFENELIGAEINRDDFVVKCDNFITAAGAGVASEFGFSIVDYLLGSTKKSQDLKNTMQYKSR